MTLEAFRLLTIYLKPVLPKVAQGVEEFLGVKPMNWASVSEPLPVNGTIQPYKHLMTRVDPKLIDVLLESNRAPQ